MVHIALFNPTQATSILRVAAMTNLVRHAPASLLRLIERFAPRIISRMTRKHRICYAPQILAHKRALLKDMSLLVAWC